MKRLFILLFALPLIGNGQTNSVLPGLMAASSSQNIREAEGRLQGFIKQLSSNKPGSETAFLKKVFRQTQRSFLNQYDSYSEFSELFTTGKYDCLTATSLFSIVLDQLNFKYSIVETNYHIFLLVRTGKGDVLLETTDRFGGFVRNPNAIRERIGSYRLPLESPGKYQYHFDLYHEVSLKQLPGLLYYNQAVKAYNSGNLVKGAELLCKAQSVYDTPRIAEFSFVFLQSLDTSNLDDQTKRRITDLLKNLTAHRPAVLASR